MPIRGKRGILGHASGDSPDMHRSHRLRIAASRRTLGVLIRRVRRSPSRALVGGWTVAGVMRCTEMRARFPCPFQTDVFSVSADAPRRSLLSRQRSPAQTPPFTGPSRALASIDANKSPIFHSVFVRHARLAVVLQNGHIVHELVVGKTAHFPTRPSVCLTPSASTRVRRRSKIPSRYMSKRSLWTTPSIPRPPDRQRIQPLDDHSQRPRAH